MFRRVLDGETQANDCAGNTMHEQQQQAKQRPVKQATHWMDERAAQKWKRDMRPQGQRVGRATAGAVKLKCCGGRTWSGESGEGDSNKCGRLKRRRGRKWPTCSTDKVGVWICGLWKRGKAGYAHPVRRRKQEQARKKVVFKCEEKRTRWSTERNETKRIE